MSQFYTTPKWIGRMWAEIQALKLRIDKGLDSRGSARAPSSSPPVSGVPQPHTHTGTGQGGIVDASAITYTPAVVTDWDGDIDPGDVNEALDQLAARGIGGGSDPYEIEITFGSSIDGLTLDQTP